jgi:methylmalonyl-CoA mutase N-terminal domain/subunit
LPKPDPALMDAHRAHFAQWKRERANDAVRNALDDLARAANSRSGDANIFASVVAAAEVGSTHGEICGLLRRELGFGHPLTAV